MSEKLQYIMVSLMMILSSLSYAITITTSAQHDGASKNITVLGGELYEIAFVLNKQSTTNVRLTISEGVSVLFDSALLEGENDHTFLPVGNTIILRFERLDAGTDTKTFSVEDVKLVLIKSRMETHCVGGKTYELSDHLGNVRAVISDKRNSGSTEVVAATDYYPFGMEMSERTFSSPKYRYGFNGMEKDQEIKGGQDDYTTHFRALDTRIGRWLTLDPKKNYSESPYASMSNNPILNTDILGDTAVSSLDGPTAKKGGVFDKANKQMVIKPTPNDGVFILTTHADPQGLEDNTGGKSDFMTTPEEIFKRLEKDPKWNAVVSSGKPVILILDACNSATDPEVYWEEGQNPVEKSIAERMSIYKPNITIVAPDGYTKSGKIINKKAGVIGATGQYGIIGIEAPVNYSSNLPTQNDGGWVTYKAGKIVDKLTVGYENNNVKDNATGKPKGN